MSESVITGRPYVRCAEQRKRDADRSETSGAVKAIVRESFKRRHELISAHADSNPGQVLDSVPDPDTNSPGITGRTNVSIANHATLENGYNAVGTSTAPAAATHVNPSHGTFGHIKITVVANDVANKNSAIKKLQNIAAVKYPGPLRSNL